MNLYNGCPDIDQTPLAHQIQSLHLQSRSVQALQPEYVQVYLH